LRPFDDTLNDPQRLAEQASSLGKPMDLITLRTDDNNNVAPAIGNLPGVVITPQAELLPTDYHFAPALMSQVKKAVVDELDGQAGWRVVSVNQNDVDVAVLHEVEPSPAPSVSVSLDRAVQNAAQRAVDNQSRQAMIVVIKPSTGEILAVAQNAAANALGPVATTGLYPPGSTFKMVTAGAALERDLASPRWSLRARPSSATWQAPTRFWVVPERSTSGIAPSPTMAASIWVWCRCHGRSPVLATPPSPNWPAGCRRAV